MTIEEQLTRDEGLRLKPYVDTVGKLTIGVGRNLTDKGISEAEAKLLLANDLADIRFQLPRVLPWIKKLDEPRYAVLINMAFNLGINGLLGFRKSLNAMLSEQWETAADEMLDSKWAYQVGARAIRLANQMRTGLWT